MMAPGTAGLVSGKQQDGTIEGAAVWEVFWRGKGQLGMGLKNKELNTSGWQVMQTSYSWKKLLEKTTVSHWM